jgi:type I restriction enzyme, S subunit
MTVDVASLVSDNLDIWTTAVERKSGAGRGGGKRVSLYGVDCLRALILDLAVRGKLVPQDSADEPASTLLKKIGAERAKLTKSGSIGKRRISENNPDDVPYPIPEGWVWTKLADIGHDWGQKEPSGDFTYIDVSSVDQRAGIIRSPIVLPASEAPSRARKIVRVGTVIYSTVRPYLLNIAIIDQEFEPEPIASTAFAIVHPFEGVTAGFLYRYLRSATFISYVEGCQTGIAYPAINDKQFFSAWFPLPPLAEQQRIVAKVDELMALCDALEAESAAAMAAHQVLVKALLATLTASTGSAELATNWARLEAHFDILFTTKSSVDALERTILELAVRGKLVAQDAHDESGETLLGKIFKEPWAKPRQNSKLRPDADALINAPAIPNSWAWATVEALARPNHTVTYGILKPVWVSEGVPTVRVTEMKTGVILVSDLPQCDPDRAERFRKTTLQAGDLLVTKDGTIGKTAFVPPELEGGNITQHVLRFPITNLVNRYFIRLVIDSPICQAWMAGETKGVALQGVNVGDFKRMPIPLPPLGEQCRIVAKVDELTSLCDALKARLTDRAETQTHLAEAIVELASV